MREFTACPVCGATRHELVAEYNGLIAHNEMRSTEMCRYDYRLCHRCGTTFASRRPTGSEYELLYSRFNEMLGREGTEGPIQRDGPVTPEVEAQLQANPAWWRLSETDSDLTAAIRRDIRLQTPYLAPLVTNCPIEGARILRASYQNRFFVELFEAGPRGPRCLCHDDLSDTASGY